MRSEVRGGRHLCTAGRYCNKAHDRSYGQGDVFSGGGSGWVMSEMQVTPLRGVKEHFPSSEVVWGPTATTAVGASVAVVCASAHAEEGWDRANLTLPEAQELGRVRGSEIGGALHERIGGGVSTPGGPQFCPRYTPDRPQTGL